MQLATVFRFGDFEVHSAAREVRRAGRVQPIAPQAFDLLHLLLSERHRALSKDELLKRLWAGRPVSDSVLPRTVMRTRLAIGDDALQPQWIRSVRRFGYRFVGEVEEIRPLGLEGGAQPLAPEPQPGQRRVGVLPFLNETGDASMDWTRVGLTALVGQALERHPGLQVLPIDHLMPVINGLRHAHADEVARQAVALLTLDHVVHATLRRQGDALWLDYQIQGAAPPGRLGSLRDAEPVRLAERLAEAVARALGPEGQSQHRFLSTDAFVNQAYARATEFAAQEDWVPAERLLAAARVLEPNSAALQLAHVRCLVWLKAPRAVAAAQDIVDLLHPAGDPYMASKAHDLLALALVMRSEAALMPAANKHRALALALAERAGSADWLVTMQLNMANHHIDRLQLQAAQTCYLQAEAGARATGNLPLLAVVLQNHSLVYRAQGDLMAARQRLDEAMQIWRRVQRRPVTAHALGLLAQVNAAIGLVDETIAQCDEAVSLVDPNNLPSYNGLVLSSAALLYLEHGQMARLDTVLALFAARWPADEPEHPACASVLGCGALSHGDFAAARRHWQQAVTRGEHWPGLTFSSKWQLAILRLEMAVGEEATLVGCHQAIERLLALAPTPELQAATWTAQAALAHLAGDDARAMAHLRKVLDQVPLGRMHHLARFDLAWLQVEAGCTDAATHLLAGAPTWRQAHPVGLAAQSRLLLALGRPSEAAEVQALAFARWPRPAPVLLQAVAKGYGQAPGACPIPELRRLPRLMSATWWLR